MRIGYCSPLNPMRSGISDFSEDIVFALKEQIEVVIFSPALPDNQNIRDQFECHLLTELNYDSLRNSLDVLVYQMGNNKNCHSEIIEMLEKYPGIVELHDVGLQNFFAGRFLSDKKDPSEYLEFVRYCQGERGWRAAQAYFQGQAGAPWEIYGLEFCTNRTVIEQAEAMIVHSDLAKQMVLGVRPDLPVLQIMFPSQAIINTPEEYKQVSRNKLGLSSQRLIFGSFGFATQSKRILPILDALKLYQDRNGGEFLYLIVGEAQKELNLQEEIRLRQLEDRVHITGFVELDEFKTYIGACDFCLNLRYPTRGETSSSLHRMLGMGKPVIVTDIGTFSEYPDEIALKVQYGEHEAEDIYQAICILKDKRELKRRSKAALKFAIENCDIKRISQQYVTFLSQVLQHSWQPDYCDILVGRLCELGLTNDAYTEHIAKVMTLKDFNSFNFV